MHGHSYRLEVAISGPVQTEGPARGMIEDFDEIERIVAIASSTVLDHQNLNDFDRKPNAENFVLWIWKHLEAICPDSTNWCCGKRQPPAPSFARATPCMLQLAEIFYSIQGEGMWTGTPAVFVRLAGCNLACDFCDTDYSTKFFASVDEVVEKVRELGGDCPMVILTGGEPLAQAETAALIEALRRDGRRVHIESNGTIFSELPDDVWLCVSPKERVDPRMAARANEAKLIVDERVPEEHLPLFAE